MQNTETPSLNMLLKATIAALLFAALALVLIILPAEYNIDPTGIGQKLGLTTLSQAALSSPSEPKNVSFTTSDGENGTREEMIEISIPAKKGLEYKLIMKQFDKVKYEWLTGGQPLFFDLHGEPESDDSGYFESYAVATLPEMKGSFTAPFDGTHGWYWENPTEKPVKVLLMVEGTFDLIAE